MRKSINIEALPTKHDEPKDSARGERTITRAFPPGSPNAGERANADNKQVIQDWTVVHEPQTEALHDIALERYRYYSSGIISALPWPQMWTQEEL